MTPKPYNTDGHSMTAAAEPAVVYGRSTSGRMSVDEYFDELWAMYLKKTRCHTINAGCTSFI